MDLTHDQPVRDENYHRQVQLVLLSTCEEMILLARKGEWRRVAELESRRSRELTEYLSLPLLESDAPGLREAIEKIAALNEQLVHMASDARRELGDRIGEVRQGARAAAAYNAARKD